MVGLSLLVLAFAADEIEDILLEAPSFLSKNVDWGKTSGCLKRLSLGGF